MNIETLACLFPALGSFWQRLQPPKSHLKVSQQRVVPCVKASLHCVGPAWHWMLPAPSLSIPCRCLVCLTLHDSFINSSETPIQ